MPRALDPRRIENAENRWTTGQPIHRIERELMAEYSCSRGSARKYLRLARKRLASIASEITPEERRARAESLLLRAYEIAEMGSADHGPDAKAMVQAVKALAEIDGLLKPTVMEIKGAVTIDGSELLREIRAARRDRGHESGAVQPDALPSEVSSQQFTR